MSQPPTSDARRRFEELARLPDEQIDLGVGAMLIAAEEYPGLDVEAELRELDALAQEVAPRLRGVDDPEDRLMILVRFLHDEQGFKGNLEAYYDPRNSFLNDVLSRHLGIPISLAVVYMEIGRRTGVPLFGAAFPGHFMVRLEGASPRFFDPFAPEALLTTEDCAELWTTVREGDAPFDPEVLEPASPRAVLVRMLRNLKLIYLQQGDFSRAVLCMDRLLLLEPGALVERRDRGVAYLKLEAYLLAAEDFEAYLAGAQGEDTPAIRAALEHAREQIARLN